MDERNIEWRKRYSSTMEADDMGRWARIGYIKGLQILWINKTWNNVYIVRGNFPVSSNDSSLYVGKFDDFETAKWQSEEAFWKFIKTVIT